LARCRSGLGLRTGLLEGCLAGLFERIEAHVVVPEKFARKFRSKREADSIARRLAENGYEVEWVRRNYGAQRESTWNIRLADGSEIHNTEQLETLGLAVPHADRPVVGGVEVVAVPREGWRRFFEYVVLERETGFEPATSTLARLRSTE
jgi:hypothetical protein